MAMSDPIANGFAIICNAQRARHAVAYVPFSKFLASILDVLTEEGYIRGYRIHSRSSLAGQKAAQKGGKALAGSSVGADYGLLRESLVNFYGDLQAAGEMRRETSFLQHALGAFAPRGVDSTADKGPLAGLKKGPGGVHSARGNLSRLLGVNMDSADSVSQASTALEPEVKAELANALTAPRVLEVLLQYHRQEPVIHKMRRISRPGRRVYVKAKNIPHLHTGVFEYGIYLLSTPKGVMGDKMARKLNVGGELIGSIV